MLKLLKKINKDIKTMHRSSEHGNVLFLILIAVALFAALSYAVTQSSRSGGGDAASESNLVNSAQITQYPASVRTSIIRMIVGGTDVASLNFDPTSDFGTTCNATPRPCVFHPSGGGATPVDAPGSVTASGNREEWVFSSDYRIENIGINTDVTGNDIIAFLPGIATAICTRLNEELGIPNTADGDSDGIPDGPTNVPDNTNEGMISGNLGIGPAPTATETIDGDFLGQPFGCYDTGATAVYYHVLVER